MLLLQLIFPHDLKVVKVVFSRTQNNKNCSLQNTEEKNQTRKPCLWEERKLKMLWLMLLKLQFCYCQKSILPLYKPHIRGEFSPIVRNESQALNACPLWTSVASSIRELLLWKVTVAAKLYFTRNGKICKNHGSTDTLLLLTKHHKVTDIPNSQKKQRVLWKDN